ncbi:hypothetical protein Bca52824_002335 [Brassica carinata]|uniref:Uncharacterized protein n=1 Tax=Brassica carinata TaxID=52824 RepID=A0A8X7WLV3_BRACI|nr:hypothetical protein Bca52824_002335 [Brassica carinata]
MKTKKTQTLAPTDALTRELENLARSNCASELLLAGEAKSSERSGTKKLNTILD